MSSVNTRKVLFFIAGTTPTGQEQDLIDRTVGVVLVRSGASAADTLYGANLEVVDAVAGLAIPTAYSEEYDDVTPALSGASVLVTNGQSTQVLADGGIAASLVTDLGVANADLVFTAKQKGSSENDITVEYEAQSAASAPLAVEVTAKAIKVKLANTAGAKQKDTATVVGTVTAAVKQKETATAAGTVTAKVKQVETATFVGTVTVAGLMNVTVTGDDIAGSPVVVPVTVALDDDAAAIAGKARTAVALNAAITAKYAVSGATDKLILTRLIERANDATLNIGIIDDTSDGVTTAATSANTTAGVASGSGLGKAVVTCAALAGSPLTVTFAVEQGDTATLWAAKCRAALAANAAIAAVFAVSGATTAVVLEKLIGGANDATFNIALSNDTSTGITTAASSTETTAGVAGGGGTAAVVITSADATGSPITLAVPVLAGDTASIVAEKIRAYLNTVTALVGNAYRGFANGLYTVGGAAATVTLERTVAKANDATLNISVDNGTCTGLTTAGTSANTTAGAAVAISSTADQIKSAIAAHPQADSLVSVADDSGNDGTGVPTAMDATALEGGTEPEVGDTAEVVVQAGVLRGVVPDA